MFDGPIVLPGLPGHPIAEDQVDLLVSVDDERCTPPATIRAFNGSWQAVSLFEIVSRGAIHFSRTQPVLGANETRADALMRLFWQEVINARPHQAFDGRHHRLVFDPVGDPDEQGRISMLVAEALAVLMVERMFNIPYTAITRVATRHDHEFLSPQGIVRVEARGRFNHANHSAAIEELDGKFGATRNFAQAVGVIAYPSDRNERGWPDLDIVDPEGETTPPRRPDRIRQVLRHFETYADSQGNDSLAELYRLLLSLSDDVLLHLFATARGSVLAIGAPTPSLGGSSVMRAGAATYYGRVIPAFAAPQWIGTAAGDGPLFWGLWSRALEATFSSEVELLLDIQQSSQISRDDNGTIFLRFSDGTLLAWAMNMEGLTLSGLLPDVLPSWPKGEWRIVHKSDGQLEVSKQSDSLRTTGLSEADQMPIVTDGPIFRAFKSTFPSDRPLEQTTIDCSASVIRLLEHHQTTAQKPGMLLGKVQSGKTRVFVGAIGIAFDSGFDVAIVLTKTSKPLAAQTIRRLEHDLAPAIEEHRVRIYDAATKIGSLNDWIQSRKLIFVAKKHPKNLENLKTVMLSNEHPAFQQKRVLVIDDEADFASTGYERREGNVHVRRVQTLINDLRTGLPKAVYLEVTATPYSLYLQPADIQEPATGKSFQAVRPAFTKRIIPHGGYVGGEFYFDNAQNTGSVASYVHVPVSNAEIAGMRQPAQVATKVLLTTPTLQSLRRSIIAFVVGGVMRRLDEAGTGRPERLFSFIIHLERLRVAHTDQQTIAQHLIEHLQTADLSAEPLASQLQTVYDDLKASRTAGGLATPTLASLVGDVGPAFASITTEVVNSDAQLQQLLDNSGQLRQSSPFNIYIGGQSLDRGVTIANVIGFFYGRDPRVAQQDTTIQHCRMYGARPIGDLTVTRFYTSNGIYARMRRMHEFDKLLWEQLRKREEDGDEVDDPADVVFLERDDTGGVSPCSPNKIVLSRIQWVTAKGELVPRPFATVSDDPYPVAVRDLISRLKAMGSESTPFLVQVDDACKLVEDICQLIRIEDGWDWDLDSLKDAIRYLAGSHPDETLRESVYCLYTLDSTIGKWRDATRTDPQRAPYTPTTEQALRKAGGRSPMLAIYHNVGSVDKGWSGSPFFWPVLFVPDGITTTVFANNRRRTPRTRRKRRKG